MYTGCLKCCGIYPGFLLEVKILLPLHVLQIQLKVPGIARIKLEDEGKVFDAVDFNAERCTGSAVCSRYGNDVWQSMKNGICGQELDILYVPDINGMSKSGLLEGSTELSTIFFLELLLFFLLFLFYLVPFLHSIYNVLLGIVDLEEIVKKCLENKIKVIPIPGACAAITALIASGIDAKEFTFLGFFWAVVFRFLVLLQFLLYNFHVFL